MINSLLSLPETLYYLQFQEVHTRSPMYFTYKYDPFLGNLLQDRIKTYGLMVIKFKVICRQGSASHKNEYKEIKQLFHQFQITKA